MLKQLQFETGAPSCSCHSTWGTCDMQHHLNYRCVSWWVKEFVYKFHVTFSEMLDKVPNGFPIQLSYCLYVSYVPTYM